LFKGNAVYSFKNFSARRKTKVMKQTQKTSNILFDLAQVANGAASALGSLRSEMDVIRAGRADRHAAASGSVPREDFDAALSRIEALAARITVLEASLDKRAKSYSKAKTKSARPAKVKSKKI
jgi:BMFP domain-containing protein YqiC